MEGICYFFLNKDQEAHKALLGAKNMLHSDKDDFDPEISGLIHYFLGSLYEYNDENDRSLECRLEAFKHLSQLHREPQWMLLAGMSRNYEQKGYLRNSVKYNTQAISLISNDDPEVAYIFEKLGSTLYELGEYKEAQEYFGRVLEVDAGFERKDDVYFSIGMCHQRLLDYQMALDSYLKLLELKELEPEKEPLSWLYIETAYCYYHLKEHKHSIEFVEKALQETIEDKEEQAEIQSYLTNNYQALGRHQEAVEAGEKTVMIHLTQLDRRCSLAVRGIHAGQRRKAHRRRAEKGERVAREAFWDGLFGVRKVPMVFRRVPSVDQGLFRRKSSWSTSFSGPAHFLRSLWLHPASQCKQDWCLITGRPRRRCRKGISKCRMILLPTDGAQINKGHASRRST